MLGVTSLQKAIETDYQKTHKKIERSKSNPMKTNLKNKALTFGDFIAAVYRASGKRKARGIVRHAVNARLIEFCGHQRFVIF